MICDITLLELITEGWFLYFAKQKCIPVTTSLAEYVFSEFSEPETSSFGVILISKLGKKNPYAMWLKPHHCHHTFRWSLNKHVEGISMQGYLIDKEITWTENSKGFREYSQTSLMFVWDTDQMDTLTTPRFWNIFFRHRLNNPGNDPEEPCSYYLLERALCSSKKIFPGSSQNLSWDSRHFVLLATFYQWISKFLLGSYLLTSLSFQENGRGINKKWNYRET